MLRKATLRRDALISDCVVLRLSNQKIGYVFQGGAHLIYPILRSQPLLSSIFVLVDR